MVQTSLAFLLWPSSHNNPKECTYQIKHAGRQVSKRQEKKTNMFLLLRVQHLHRPPTAQHPSRAASTGRNTKLSLDQTRALRCLRTWLTLDCSSSTTTFIVSSIGLVFAGNLFHPISHSSHKAPSAVPPCIYICTYALDQSGDGRTRTYDQYADREYDAAVVYSICEARRRSLSPFDKSCIGKSVSIGDTACITR